FPSPTLTLPSSVKLDISARRRVLALAGRDQLSLTARVENALDKKYQDVIGYPSPRRVVLIGAEFSGTR
ncbi:MAG: hypothetical protein M3Z17_01010, partial [Gemmatimonadota bacterium]|nr:hypothetical protein [Gemmatimonadota bacterium]